ncbi:MAG: hypothetical protein LBL21_03610 [Rickettsiales bacterium]|jgi:hypothetical protein|nr:hypothetical protein [Rickettsiales bacterium]
MKKNHTRFATLSLVSCLLSLNSAHADNYVIVDKSTCAGGSCVEIPVNPDPDGGGAPVFRADIQSTSVDWEAVSGLRLREYKLTFSGTNVVGKIGWEMYFLDGFPCYGFAQYTRTWVGQKKGDGFLRANCVRQPKEILLAYRVAKKEEFQGRTTGILKCPVAKNMVVKLDECEKQDWADFARE